MPPAVRSVYRALFASVTLAVGAGAVRISVDAERSAQGSDANLSRAEQFSLEGCPLFYERGVRTMSTHSVDTSRWSRPAQTAIKVLELHDAAGHGVSWETFTDTQLDPEGRWILQSPPENVWGHGDGRGQVLEMLHHNNRCSSKHDAGCDPDFKLLRCDPGEPGEGCPRGGTCRPFAATKTAPGMKPRSLCAGPADEIVDRYYDVIAQAKTFVDIVSLEIPDGRFLAAIRNALTYQQNLRLQILPMGAMQVRLLFGHLLGESLADLPLAATAALSNLDSGTTLEIMLRDIMRDLDPEKISGTKSPLLRVAAGTLRFWPDSWNHAKIVAADGERMIQGGINFWTRDYLEHDPVFDLSMEASGGAAAAAVRFADTLWEALCTGVVSEKDIGFAGGFSYFPYSVDKAVQNFKQHKHADPVNPLKDEKLPAAPMSPWQSFPQPLDNMRSPNGANTLAIGRMGALGSNAADLAFTALLQAARRSIKISQQDFGPATSLIGWRYDYIDAICYAMVQGAEVEIMLSRPNFVPSPTSAITTLIRVGAAMLKDKSATKGLSALKATMHAYGMGYKLEDVLHQFQLRLAHMGANVEEALERLTMVYLLGNLQPEGWGNHAKFFMVDDRTFVVGSQNMYACNLQEFSLVIDDAAAAERMLEAYWRPLWARSATPKNSTAQEEAESSERGPQDASKALVVRKREVHAKCTPGSLVHKAAGDHCAPEPKSSRRRLGCAPNVEEHCYEAKPSSRCCCKRSGVLTSRSWTAAKKKKATVWC